MAINLVRWLRVKVRTSAGKTKIYGWAKEGRLKLVNVGPGNTRFVEDDEKSPGSIDALIDELIKAGHVPKVMPERPERPKAKSARKKQRS
jgi:hypothetical protein